MRLKLAVAIAVMMAGHEAPAINLTSPDKRLYNRCTPMSLFVADMTQDAVSIGLSKSTVENAVESRLRAARVFSDEHSRDSLYVQLDVLKSGEQEVVFGVDVSLNRYMEDNGFGTPDFVEIWSTGTIGFAGSNNHPFIVGAVSKYLDEFLTKFLRANDRVCRMKDRGDFDGLLTVEGITLARYRKEYPNVEDHGLAKTAWVLGGYKTGLQADEFCRQFLEIPRDKACPIKDFGDFSTMTGK